MKRKLLLIAQFALTALVVWFVGKAIVEQWHEARSVGFALAPRWERIVAGSALVLGAYAVLIEAWRRVVTGWGSHLRYRDAARIWFISNLGRYVPGKVWQLTAMAVLAERVGVSRYAAAGSALLVNLANIVAGIGVVAFTAAGLLGHPVLWVGGAGTLVVLLALTPRLLPALARLYGRLRGRPTDVPVMPAGPIWLAAALSGAAWGIYGVAFMLFSQGIVPGTAGDLGAWIAAFTASYLAGYLFLPAPGGIGVREGALLALLDQLALTTAGTGAVIAAASRLWLTVLEVLPGALYLLLGAVPDRFRNPIAHERTD